MASLRVCLLTLDVKPHRSSGLATYAEDLARGLAELDHSITVVVRRRSGPPVGNPVTNAQLVGVTAGALDWISFAWYAARWLESIRHTRPFDVVHFCDVHFAYAYGEPFVASVWQSFRQRLTAAGGRPYHRGILDRLRREIYYRIARRFMEEPSVARTGRFIASCQSTRDEFIRHYHVPQDRIDLNTQGIDTSQFRPVPTGNLRRRLGLDNCRVLLFLGFATPRKDLETLAAALQRLDKDVHLVIAGQWERGYRPRVLKALGPAVGRVHEVGYIPDHERPAYYSLADVYVSPSLLEGLGITPIEAMACGTPAIVTAASSGPEEVGDAGRTVPPRDPQALAAAVRELLADDGLRRRLGDLGRQRVHRLFTDQRMAKKTVQTYEQFLG